MQADTPEQELAGFLGKFAPEIQDQAQEVLNWMREMLPGAVEMVYDNFYALVIGFSPTERPSDAVFSVVVYPKWVSICFLQAVRFLHLLDCDPEKLLKGKGTTVRHIRLKEAAELDLPAVRDLFELALATARTPFDPNQPSRMIIKMVSARQRPRRSE